MDRRSGESGLAGRAESAGPQPAERNIFCTSAKHFPVVNAIYARYFPEQPPARIFVCIPEWTGLFDIEIDCIAVI
jgi:enamine deaminase RidA (YjgF/YER057c/UK114 family)